MGEWRALVAETVTGLIVSDVVLKGRPQFKRALCDKGSWQVELNIGEGANRGTDFHPYVENGARYSWVIAYDEYICQAGPVRSHAFTEESRTLSVAGSGLGGILGNRVSRGQGVAGGDVMKSQADLTYSTLSLKGIACALVSVATSDWPTRPGYALPLTVPTPTSFPGDEDYTYYGYDLRYTWDNLADLAEEENGIEFDFAPYFVPGENRIAWEFLVESPRLGNQESLAVWDYGGALSRIDVDVNSSAAFPTSVWVKGSGSERELKVGYAQIDRPAQFPAFDYVDTSHVSEEEQKKLSSYAQSTLGEFAAPSEKWSCTVRVDGLANQSGVQVAPRLGEFALGDAPLFGVSRHPWIADGEYRRRILGFSDKSHAEVALEIGETPLVI